VLPSPPTNNKTTSASLHPSHPGRMAASVTGHPCPPPPPLLHNLPSPPPSPPQHYPLFSSLAFPSNPSFISLSPLNLHNTRTPPHLQLFPLSYWLAVRDTRLFIPIEVSDHSSPSLLVITSQHRLVILSRFCNNEVSHFVCRFCKSRPLQSPIANLDHCL
jgi:hypothetical protein